MSIYIEDKPIIDIIETLVEKELLHFSVFDYSKIDFSNVDEVISAMKKLDNFLFSTKSNLKKEIRKIKKNTKIKNNKLQNNIYLLEEYAKSIDRKLKEMRDLISIIEKEYDA